MKKEINQKDIKRRDTIIKENVSFSFFKWILKTETIIIVVTVIVMSIFYLIPNKIKLITKYKIQNLLVSNYQIYEKNKKYRDIENSIDSNRFLEVEEKNFIKKFFEKEFEENKKYIDTKLVTDRLKNLKVVYSAEENLKKNNINIVGSYNVLFNKINILDKEVNNFDSINKDVYFHEVNHLFTKYTLKNSLNFANNLNKDILSETVNELFTREYLDNYELITNNAGYEEYMYYIYALAELLEIDTLKQYKFYDNESILISGLLKIDNNFDKAYELINSINSVDLDNSEIYKKIHDSYSYFYKKKYNKEISENLDILIYFYNTKVLTDKEREILRNNLKLDRYDREIKFIPKGYISENYKFNHNKIIISSKSIFK